MASSGAANATWTLRDGGPATSENVPPPAPARANCAPRLGRDGPRADERRESLEAAVVDPVVAAVARACGAPVGVATGAWVEPDPERRAALVAAWREPACASVNLSEPGAAGVMPALLGAGIAVEAGVWSPEDAERLAATGLAARVARVLVEVVGGPARTAVERALAIEAALAAC